MEPVDPRAIRVFISSTFRDMQLERDELVKRVFPQVRRLCERRGVAWSEIDLRWGVTDEQKAEGEVLPICLAEIERTRPYFIGLLGQRYGWVPDEIPNSLADELGWLADDRGRSVTELEILHGVLNSPDAAGHALFYLRDPAWVESLPADERAVYLEETDTGVRRLAELRDRIRASGHPTRDYPDPVALGDLVLADLVALVEARYPDAAPPDPSERDDSMHAAFAAARHTGFVERPALAARLDEHLHGDGPPLLVTGESGVGASALVAAWSAAQRETGVAVVEHHVEADATAADPVAMSKRLVRALSRPDERPDALPDEPVALRSALRQALHGVDRRTVVVIDGADRLDDVDRAPDLRWLPTDVPPLVRLVVVASGERPRTQATHRGFEVLEVPPLDETERRTLAQRFLARYAKGLDEVHLAALVGSERTGNARYLRIVLDELRQHGDHFTLGPTIEHLCGAASVDDLYELVLGRYEADYERDRAGLTRSVFTALWAARRGLAEAELLELLGSEGPSPAGGPLPQAVWAPLHLAAEHGLVNRAGLIGFANDDLRRAVEDRYLPSDDDRRRAHARLAAYFAARDLGDRVVDELAWQQIAAGDTDGLGATLRDLGYTELASRRASADLRRAWARATEAGHSMVDAFRAVIEDPAAHDVDGGAGGDGGDDDDGDDGAGEPRQLVWGVARLLSDAGHPDEALSVQRHLVEAARRRPADRSGEGDGRLRAALVNLGATLWSQGRHADAEATLVEAVERCRAAGDEAMLAAALGNLAMARRDLGGLDGADALFAEEAELCHRRDDEFGLQASLANRAELLRRLGRYDEALELLGGQEMVCRDLADDVGIARALAGQATVLADRGDVAGAIRMTELHAVTAREHGDVRGLAEALLNLTVMHAQVGATADAIRSGDEADAIARRLTDPSLLARVLVARASALSPTGDWPNVEHLAREGRAIADQAGLPAQAALALGMIGTARREQGDLAGCRAAHAEELELATSTGDPQAIATAHANLGNVAIAEQRLADALAHYAIAEPVFREHQVLSSLLPLLANRGQVHQATGQHPLALSDLADAALAAATLGHHAGAVQWAEPAVQLATALGDTARAESLWSVLAASARAIGDDARLQQALGERALLLIGRAQPGGAAGTPATVDQALLAEAARLLDEQEEICRRIGHAVGLAACVGNRAIVLRYQGDLAASLACLDEQLRIAQASGDGQGVLFATANRGEVLGLLGRVPEAMEALGWARNVAAQHGIVAMVQQLDAMIAGLRSRN